MSSSAISLSPEGETALLFMSTKELTKPQTTHAVKKRIFR